VRSSFDVSVDGLLPTKANQVNVPKYANLGPQNAIWVSIAESFSRTSQPVCFPRFW
jgi:hypothetical protein